MIVHPEGLEDLTAVAGETQKNSWRRGDWGTAEEARFLLDSALAMDPVRTLLDWIDIPSVTGAEGDYGDALARSLAALGLQVERQQLSPGRFNVLARAGTPE